MAVLTLSYVYSCYTRTDEYHARVFKRASSRTAKREMPSAAGGGKRLPRLDRFLLSPHLEPRLASPGAALNTRTYPPYSKLLWTLAEKQPRRRGRAAGTRLSSSINRFPTTRL